VRYCNWGWSGETDEPKTREEEDRGTVPARVTTRVKEGVTGEGQFRFKARICQEGEGEGDAPGEEGPEEEMEELRLA